MIIGAHVSTRGGIDNAPHNAARVGADAMQIHPTSAQQWRRAEFDDITVQRFLGAVRAAGVQRTYLHAIYLINLATPDATLLRRSVESLVHFMEIARRLGAQAVVVHPGSHVGAGFAAQLPQVRAAVAEVLDRSESPVHLLIENSAGAGGCVGRSFEEVAAILAARDDPRLRMCLDTQHMFASGYDIRDPESRKATLRALDDNVGLERIALVHCNDSTRALGSNADRHANVGEGEIGEAAFRGLLATQELRAVPWILEVPGADRGGPDLQQINLIRDCAGLAPTTARSAA